MNLPFLAAGLISGFLLFWALKKYYQPFFRLSEASLKILNSLLMSEEDDSKVKEVEKHLAKLLAALGLFFLWIVVILMLAAIPVGLYGLFYKIPFSDLELDSWPFILSLSIGSLIPFIPLKRKEKLSYSEISKLFHRLILDNYQLGKRLFNYEKKKFGNIENPKEDFVLVSGLARAGTTSLMLSFNEVENFKSLDYSNMPLLMAPNLWKKFYSPKDGSKKERAHGDGIQVGLNSAEALEEYFFKLHLNDSFISEEHLHQHEIPETVFEQYLLYQSFILKSEREIYLAKNNNLLLRYASLREQNTNFKVIFMFRDPLTHAYSLLSQHRRYLESQTEDPFVLEYMNWLGHHEFGLGQKSFSFQGSQEIEGDKNKLDYWLKVWTNYYQSLMSFVEDENLYLLEYSDYCDYPNQILNQIMDGIGIDYVYEGIDPFSNQKEIKEAYSKEVLESSTLLYKGLLKHKLKIKSL